MKMLPIVLLLLGLNTLEAAEKIYDISRLGAVGDGKTLNTRVIQQVIDDCSKQGGGKVRIPAGTWLSGTLLLKSGVTLSLDQNAVLLGSSNIDDYRLIEPFTDGNGATLGYCLVCAVGANNIGIEGKGAIDGQGREVFKSGGKSRRPFLLRMLRCNRISFQVVTLRNSTAWAVHLFECRDITARGVAIRSKGLANNDGFDIDGSQNVTIAHCDIDTGDDAVCLKTTGNSPCRNVSVTDSKLASGWAAFKIGTETHADVEHIRVSRCEVPSATGAIKIFAVDGARAQDIEISDITIEKDAVPIQIRLGARLRTFVPGDAPKDMGFLKNVVIRNIKATRARDIGMFINGIPNHRIENLTIENVAIGLAGGGKPEDASLKIPENEKAYPDIETLAKRLPVSSVYMRHVDGMKMRNVRITHEAPDPRPAVYVLDGQNLEFTDVRLPANEVQTELLWLESVRNALLSNCVSGGNLKSFLRVDGSDSSNIVLRNNTVVASGPLVVRGENVPADAVKTSP
jgi:polygalacturonase